LNYFVNSANFFVKKFRVFRTVPWHRSNAVVRYLGKTQVWWFTNELEVKNIHDKAEALRIYMKQTKEGLEMQNWCAEIKIRVEKRAGELLGEMAKNRGGNPNWLHPATSSQPTLEDLGLEKTQAHRWQTIGSRKNMSRKSRR
jgi:hypothetical protein